MKRLITAALLVLANQASAFYFSHPCPCEWAGSFDMGGGYRQDHFNCDTFIPSSPQRRIQEQWDNLSIGVIEANGNLYFGEAFLLADFSYGWVCGGNHRFKNIDLPTHQTVQHFTSKTTGDVWDISGGIGYQFNFCHSEYAFAPIIGFSYHRQELKNSHYHDHLLDTPHSGRSSFSYRFCGPWAGLLFGYMWTCDLQLYLDYRFHWIRFKANVNQDLGIVVQDHRTKTHLENEVTLGINYDFCGDWWTGFKVNYRNLNTTKKHGHPDHGDGNTRLGNLRWESLTLTLDVGYSF